MRGFFSIILSPRRRIRTTASTHHIFSLRLSRPPSDVFIGARQIPVSSLPTLSLGHAYLIGQRHCCNTSYTQSPLFSSDDLLDTSSSEVPKSMKMEVRIISTENIKPTSPTPLHLRTYKLSLLDQLFSNMYEPFVFFYPNNHRIALKDVIHERSQLLKQSLSEALTRFYPFAGKIKDDLHIDCSDEGVYYIEAQINNRLSDLLNHPNDQFMIHPLIPYDPTSMDSILIQGSYVVMIQVNFFNCGGIAIIMCTSHKIIDGNTYTMFLKAWASIASGSSEQLYPSFIAPSLFPQNLSLPQGISRTTSKLKEVKFVTRRFVFDASALVALKAKASNLSRVVAVTTLIWKCGIAASSARYGFQKPSVLSIVVNLRRRFSPYLSEYCVGNLVWGVVSQWMPKTELKLHSMMCHVKNAIAKINSDFVAEIKGDDGALKVGEHLQEIGKIFAKDNPDHFDVSSMCNSGLYEADFGWGKPIWLYRIASTSSTNMIFLTDTRSGNGIEAWVTLNEQDMAIVERDPELLSFASLNPSPI